MTTEPLPFTRPRTRSRERLGPSPADSLIQAPTAPASDLGRRVTRLLLLRTVVVSVVLGLSLWILATAQDVPRGAMWLQSGIIALTYLTSIVFGVLLRRGMAPREVAGPMHAADPDRDVVPGLRHRRRREPVPRSSTRCRSSEPAPCSTGAARCW